LEELVSRIDGKSQKLTWFLTGVSLKAFHSNVCKKSSRHHCSYLQQWGSIAFLRGGVKLNQFVALWPLQVHCRVSFKRKPLEREPLSLLFIKVI